jgi:hypothetical protein
MATKAQQQAARQNIKKAAAKWQSMSSREHARAQPEGRARARPGTKGSGSYYHVMVRPKSGFSSFRTQDVGRPGHSQRVAGRRPSGSWATVKWLISKNDAHVEGSRLVADTRDAMKVLDRLGSTPIHERGDRFVAKDRPNIPEKDKPTSAQRRAQRQNIRKAQAARRARRRQGSP